MSSKACSGVAVFVVILIPISFVGYYFGECLSIVGIPIDDHIVACLFGVSQFIVGVLFGPLLCRRMPV